MCLSCVIHGLSFFFFKQKTAYEMRISDWSSDVCSSDLRQGAPNVGIEVNVGAQRLGDSRFEVILHLEAKAEGGGNTFFVAGLDYAGEIGRASCRERVCQYV